MLLVCQHYLGAIKRLFPGYLETAWQSGRSHCHGFKVDKADSVDIMCKEYADEWARLENEAEQKRQVEHARAEQVSPLILWTEAVTLILTVTDGGSGSGSASGRN